jgi:hypothetical protein
MSYYAQKRKTKAILIASLSVIVLILLFVAYMRANKEKISQTVVVDERPERNLSDKPSKISIAGDLSRNITYTSYRLGVRFSYNNTLYGGDADQCPPNYPNCPKVNKTGDTNSPVEKDNSITFRGYRLEVFDKRGDESMEEAIQKNIFPTESLETCRVKLYSYNSDDVVKAVIDPSSDPNLCPSRYRGFLNGRHFFVYPTYPNVLFFAEGGQYTKALFSHKGIWIDSIEISQ